MWLSVGVDGDLLALSSVVTDANTRSVTTSSRWVVGHVAMDSFDVSSCSTTKVPLPTEPTVGAVIDDAIGPLDDPASAGYTPAGPGVFTRVEGLSIRVIRLGAALSEREVELTDPRAGTVQSHIDSIAIDQASQPAPDPLPTPACTSAVTSLSLG